MMHVHACMRGGRPGVYVVVARASAQDFTALAAIPCGTECPDLGPERYPLTVPRFKFIREFHYEDSYRRHRKFQFFNLRYPVRPPYLGTGIFKYWKYCKFPMSQNPRLLSQITRYLPTIGGTTGATSYDGVSLPHKRLLGGDAGSEEKEGTSTPETSTVHHEEEDGAEGPEAPGPGDNGEAGTLQQLAALVSSRCCWEAVRLTVDGKERPIDLGDETGGDCRCCPDCEGGQLPYMKSADILQQPQTEGASGVHPPERGASTPTGGGHLAPGDRPALFPGPSRWRRFCFSRFFAAEPQFEPPAGEICQDCVEPTWARSTHAAIVAMLFTTLAAATPPCGYGPGDVASARAARFDHQRWVAALLPGFWGEAKEPPCTPSDATRVEGEVHSVHWESTRLVTRLTTSQPR